MMTEEQEKQQAQMLLEIAEAQKEIGRRYVGKWFKMTYHPKNWCYYACAEIDFTMIAVAYDTENRDFVYIPVIYDSECKKKNKWRNEQNDRIDKRYILIAWTLLPKLEEWIIDAWNQINNDFIRQVLKLITT